MLPLDEEVVDFGFEILGFFLDQAGDFPPHQGDTLIQHVGKPHGGVIHQFVHVVLGELALAVQFQGNFVELLVDRLAGVVHHLPHPFPGPVDGRLGGGDQAFAGVVDGFLEHGHLFLKARFLKALSSPERSLRILP